MLGVLTTVIINLTEQQTSLEKRTETNAELGFFHTRISEIFNDRRACENTLNQGNASPPLRTVSNNMAITGIRDNTDNGGAILYGLNYQFGTIISGTDRTFMISSMFLEFDTTSLVTDPDGDGTANDVKGPATLVVVYQVSTLLTSYQGPRQKNKSISLGDIQLKNNGGTYSLRGCVGNTSFISLTPRQACESISGVFDVGITTIDQCRLPHFTPSAAAQICSSADGGYCTSSWSPTNVNDRQSASARSMVDYMNRVYGKGTIPDSNNLFLGWEAGEDSIHNLPNNNNENNDPSQARGVHNTFIGVGAGEDNTTGDHNIFIGNGIASSADTDITITGKDQLNIGNLIIGRTLNNANIGNAIIGGRTGLTVNGGMHIRNHIKIGTSTLACNATNVASLRRNGNDLQFCDGTAWTKISQ